MNEAIATGNPSPLELAGQFGITDPKMLRMIEIMSNQEDDEAADEAPDDHGGNLDVWNELLRENRELHKENEYLIAQIEILASALGACPVCWGEDEQCDGCQGRGTPGSFLPDKQAFEDFVLPTVRKMRKRQRARRMRTEAPRQAQHDENDHPKTTPDEVRGRKEKK